MADNPKYTVGGMLGIGALVLTGCAVVIVLATFLFGYVTGYEFNPQTFARRRFGFYEIPLVRLQVTPLFRVDSNGEVEDLVQTQKYVTPRPGAAEEWHLMTFHRSTHTPPPTDAQILGRYLDAETSESGTYWYEWSVQHPDLAPILWPEVARLARLELYVLMPPLFELARQAEDDPKVFAADLKELQVKQLEETAQRLQTRSAAVEDADAKDELNQRATALLDAAKAASDEIGQERKKEDPPTKPAEGTTPVPESNSAKKSAA
jgi:hypothetical protein